MKNTGRDDYLKSRLSLSQSTEDRGKRSQTDTESQGSETQTHGDISAITDGMFE